MFLKDNKRRIRKKVRVRKNLSGTAERPRISVFRSAANMRAQMIDDVKRVTVVSASSLSKEILDEIKGSKGKVSKSKLVGKLLAKKALELGISTAVFDRSGYEYHGRVKAVADGVREGGVKV